MIWLFKAVVTGVLGSFHNEPGGFSGRKLAAFFATLMAAYNLRYASAAIAVEMTIVWLTFALLCLGIITIQQVIDLRTAGTKSKNTPTPPAG